MLDESWYRWWDKTCQHGWTGLVPEDEIRPITEGGRGPVPDSGIRPLHKGVTYPILDCLIGPVPHG